MLLQRDTFKASMLSAHVTDFASAAELRRWRREAKRDLPFQHGLGFVKRLTCLGSKQSFGFATGRNTSRMRIEKQAAESRTPWPTFDGKRELTQLRAP